MITTRRSRLPRLKDAENRPVLYSLLLILCGTIGATSRTVPNNLLSYGGFALLMAFAAVRVGTGPSRAAAGRPSLRGYDLMPLALLAVWLYGLLLGFAAGHPPVNVIRNFFAMTLYSIYYVLWWGRVRKFDLLRCVLIAAAVNTAYMFGFFAYDKGWGRVVAEPTYFRLFAVRDYYSEALILLMAPAALLVHRLLTPPPGASARVFGKRDLLSAALLYVYLFAFLQISLSKSTLLAYLLGALLTTVFLGRNIGGLLARGAPIRVLAVAGTVVLSLYPMTQLLAYVAGPDRVQAPVAPALAAGRYGASPAGSATEPPVLRPPGPPPAIPVAAPGATASPAVSEFLEAVKKRVPAGTRVLIRPENAGPFESLPGLIYSGVTGPGAPAPEELAPLERGHRPDIAAAVDRLALGYLIVQTAQPALPIFEVCRFGLPLERSQLFTVEPGVRYAFELYAIEGCRRPPLIGRLSDALVESKDIRRRQAANLVADLRFSGRGLGAPVRSNLRDPGSYGFEHNYLNLLHKFGVFALVIFAVYVVTLARTVLAARRFRTRHLALASTALAAGLIMGFGNPMLMSPIMVTLHCIVLYWLRPPAGLAS